MDKWHSHLHGRKIAKPAKEKGGEGEGKMWKKERNDI